MSVPLPEEPFFLIEVLDPAGGLRKERFQAPFVDHVGIDIGPDGDLSAQLASQPSLFLECALLAARADAWVRRARQRHRDKRARLVVTFTDQGKRKEQGSIITENGRQRRTFRYTGALLAADLALDSGLAALEKDVHEAERVASTLAGVRECLMQRAEMLSALCGLPVATARHRREEVGRHSVGAEWQPPAKEGAEDERPDPDAGGREEEGGGAPLP